MSNAVKFTERGGVTISWKRIRPPHWAPGEQEARLQAGSVGGEQQQQQQQQQQQEQQQQQQEQEQPQQGRVQGDGKVGGVRDTEERRHSEQALTAESPSEPGTRRRHIPPSPLDLAITDADGRSLEGATRTALYASSVHAYSVRTVRGGLQRIQHGLHCMPAVCSCLSLPLVPIVNGEVRSRLCHAVSRERPLLVDVRAGRVTEVVVVVMLMVVNHY